MAPRLVEPLDSPGVHRKFTQELFARERQKRFAHLFGKHPDEERIARIQRMADQNIADFGLLE